MYFDTAMLTSSGGREDNEDYCGYHMKDDGIQGCWALADGLGGHMGGALASRAAVEAVLANYETNPALSGEALAAHLEAANLAVQQKQQNEPNLASMRTTLVILVTSGESALWAHVGDSRLYHFRSGKVTKRTQDHSVPQRLADAGEITEDQIRFHEDRNRLLRSLGAKADPGGTILKAPVEIQSGDAFLLCSDGFWEWVTESEMEEDLAEVEQAEERPTSAAWLSAMEARLTARATPENDNYSAVAVIASANPGAAPPAEKHEAKLANPLSRLRRWLHGPE
jgi:serine/threonine protein phosphatase PrpC